jgi:hypothetical protein
VNLVGLVLVRRLGMFNVIEGVPMARSSIRVTNGRISPPIRHGLSMCFEYPCKYDGKRDVDSAPHEERIRRNTLWRTGFLGMTVSAYKTGVRYKMRACAHTFVIASVYERLGVRSAAWYK